MSPTLSRGSPAAILRRLRDACAIAVLAAALPAAAADDTRLEAAYSITIRGVPVGQATSEVRFTDKGYAAAIAGSVSSFLRLFSDASADLAGTGRIAGDRLLPMTYEFATAEGDDRMRVTMSMRDGSVVDYAAEPPARAKRRMIPVTPQHLHDVVDPLTAFLVATKPGAAVDGRLACDRTIRVFDGWQRFDLQLSWKSTERVEGGADTYDGDVFVCAARYVPIAGHRKDAKSVKDLVGNRRLEVWLAPVADRPLLAPYRILIGDTRLGDLVVASTRFKVTPADKRAAK
jgi:hypothetical protein